MYLARNQSCFQKIMKYSLKTEGYCILIALAMIIQCYIFRSRRVRSWQVKVFKLICVHYRKPRKGSLPSIMQFNFQSPRCPHELKGTGNGSLSFYRKEVSSMDTGWYACATKDVQIENNFRILNHTHEDIAWIYVYVACENWRQHF